MEAFFFIAVPVSLCVRAAARAWIRSAARAPILQPIIHGCLLVLCVAPLRVLHQAMEWKWRMRSYDVAFDVAAELVLVAMVLMLAILLDMNFGRMPAVLPRAVARQRRATK
ncbi:MAG: hypothetical protein M4D80_27780 [Myxococcota bacterium]|nr:hypothetical protein [Deltaproteobacteria bacterium]MDQ3338982.1 hypothetical protein [Myxococcota bacterium]